MGAVDLGTRGEPGMGRGEPWTDGWELRVLARDRRGCGDPIGLSVGSLEWLPEDGKVVKDPIPEARDSTVGARGRP